MKRFRTSLAAKTAAVLLALAVGAGGFWSTVFILYQWDTLWLGSGYYDSNDYYSDLYNRSSQVRELARLLQNQEWNGALPYLDQRRLDMLEEALSPERTNFRFAIRRNDTGTLVYSNLEGAASLDESVHAVEQEELSLTQNGAAREQDYVVWNGKEQYYLLYIALPDAAGTKQLVPPEDAGLAAQYGYTFDGYTWNYDEQMDSRVTTSVLALEYGATDPLTVQDEFWDSYQDYQQYASYLPALAVLALVLDIAGILLLVFLLRAAGWRKEESRPRCNWFDRIPLDLLAFGAFWAIALLLNAGDAIAFGLNVSQLATDLLVGMCVITVAILGCVLAISLHPHQDPHPVEQYPHLYAVQADRPGLPGGGPELAHDGPGGGALSALPGRHPVHHADHLPHPRVSGLCALLPLPLDHPMEAGAGGHRPHRGGRPGLQDRHPQNVQ